MSFMVACWPTNYQIVTIAGPDQFSFLEAFHASGSQSSRPSILSESEEDEHSVPSSHSIPSSPVAPTATYGLSMLNSGPSVNDDDDEEEEEEEFRLTSGKDCPTARTEALEAWKNDPSIKLVIPQCTPFGTYQEVQCYDTFCWCVDINKGLPMKGSATPANATANGFRPPIDCSNKKDVISRVQKECPIEEKLTFLKLLILHFEQEMIRNVKRNRGDGHGRTFSGKNTKDVVINWKFNKLDTNKNKVLEKDEWRKFKRQLKRNKSKSVDLGNSTRTMSGKDSSFNGQNGQDRSGHRRGRNYRNGSSSVSESMKAVRKYRHCFKYFFKGCDIEPRDKKVTQEEWYGCTGINMSEEEGQHPPTESPRNERRRTSSSRTQAGSSMASFAAPRQPSISSQSRIINNHRTPISSLMTPALSSGMSDEISRKRKNGRRKGPNPFSTILKAD